MGFIIGSFLFLIPVGREIYLMKEYSHEETRDLYRLYCLYKQTFEAIYKAREAELRKHGITPEQAITLIMLHTMGKEATPTRLASWLFREPNSALTQLRRMQKMGLIKMDSDKKNKHIIRIQITEKGYKSYNNDIKYSSASNALEVLSGTERQQFLSILHKVRKQALNNLKLNRKSKSDLTDALMMPFTENEDPTGPAL
jgi:DNA-binding MarR family transcriptional regulator